jgi:cytochrome d ubiquinol oxidase subunit II
MFWPYLIPYSVTVANAAAPDASLRFLFYGAVVVLPAIATYTIRVYWVFRGKFHEDRLDERSTASEVAHRKGSIG